MTDEHDNSIATIEDWLRVLDVSSYYELLGVLEIESQDGIRAAFHRFSQSFHPDRHRQQHPEIREAVARIYRRGTEAYGVLRDEKQRAAYDLGLAQGRLRHARGLSQRPRAALDLMSLARTKAAKLHAAQAQRALAENRLDQAKHLLRRAVQADDGNFDLETQGRALIALVERGNILPSG